MLAGEGLSRAQRASPRRRGRAGSAALCDRAGRSRAVASRAPSGRPPALGRCFRGRRRHGRRGPRPFELPCACVSVPRWARLSARRRRLVPTTASVRMNLAVSRCASSWGEGPCIERASPRCREHRDRAGALPDRRPRRASFECMCRVSGRTAAVRPASGVSRQVRRGAAWSSPPRPARTQLKCGENRAGTALVIAGRSRSHRCNVAVTARQWIDLA